MQPEDEFYEDISAKEGIEEDEDIESLKEALAQVRQEAKKNLENWQRTQADFINYKRRSQQEKEEIGQHSQSLLLCSLLPILDDLERALGNIPRDMAKTPWIEGIRLIERKFHNILKSQGIKAIKARGKAFDPNLHEAAMSTKGKEGVVVKELLKGYKLGDRVIRPSRVAVGSGEE
jgi:molecular chaperone GrpE